jgi:8-oxo-dGTP pyrophosphatase MutT (NUDIX family)
MGSGILPVAEHNNTILFLFGKEYDNKQWSDFGGHREKNETKLETAIREGYEETNGFLGTHNELKTIVKNSKIMNMETENGYNTYMFKIPYDPNLPLYFNNHHKFVATNFPEKLNNDGFFEKSTIKWFSYDDIVKEKSKFRPFYKEIISIIQDNHTLIKRLILKAKY